MNRNAHPDLQTAFNVLLQLGVPEKDARAIARVQTTPAIVGFLAVALARLVATMPREESPLAELLRMLRAAAPTRTADHPFFYPLVWPAVFFGGPIDGRRGSVSLLQPRVPHVDRDGNLHTYEGVWWRPLYAWRVDALRNDHPREPVPMRFVGTTPPPADWDDELDDGDEWKRSWPRGSGR
jgi:hypothetical protein